MVAQPTDPTVTEMMILKGSGKIPAIKAYRERVHCGLKEAKDAIEDAGLRIGFLVRDETGLDDASGRGRGAEEAARRREERPDSQRRPRHKQHEI